MNLEADLAEIFGKVMEKEYEFSEEHRLFHTDDLRIDTYCPARSDETLVSVDLRKCFNKVSQSPIHFVLPLSKRKRARVHSAINFLLANKKDAAGFFCGLPGFDDLDESVRGNFYGAIYKGK